MKNFIQPGVSITLPAPSGGVVSGKYYKIGLLFGIAAQTVAAGVQFDLKTGGVYDVEKPAGIVFATGDAVYATPAGVLTATASGNNKIGVATAAAATADLVARVRLNSDF